MFPDEPSQGYQYAIMSLRIVNESSGQFNTNPFKFSTVVDNVVYSPALAVNLENPLQNVDLLPDGETSGEIAFEIPLESEERGILCEPYYGENFEFVWHNLN